MATCMNQPKSHRIDRFAARRLCELTPIADDKTVTTSGAADLLQVTESFLSLGRNADKPYGPPYHRLGERSGYYVVGEIKAWLEERAQAFNHRNPK